MRFPSWSESRKSEGVTAQDPLKERADLRRCTPNTGQCRSFPFQAVFLGFFHSGANALAVPPWQNKIQPGTTDFISGIEIAQTGMRKMHVSEIVLSSTKTPFFALFSCMNFYFRRFKTFQAQIRPLLAFLDSVFFEGRIF